MALIDRTAWGLLIDGDEFTGTLWTKDKIKTVVLDPIDAAIAEAGWDLIASLAVGAVASVDVVAGLNYREILVVIKGVATASSTFIRVRVSTDGGATWLTGSNSDTVNSSGTGGAANIDLHLNASTVARSAWLTILNFNKTTEPKIVTSGIGALHYLINSSAVLNALQIIPTSGNFTAGGTLSVYGRA